MYLSIQAGDFAFLFPVACFMFIVATAYALYEKYRTHRQIQYAKNQFRSLLIAGATIFGVASVVDHVESTNQRLRHLEHRKSPCASPEPLINKELQTMVFRALDKYLSRDDCIPQPPPMPAARQKTQ